MALFDSLLNEVNDRFQLSGKSSSLLAALLQLITEEKRGGLLGFLDLFRRAGLGDVVNTWIGEGANTPLSNQQIEDAFGENTLSEIANRVGLPVATATSALAFMTPAVIDGLTPEGVVPSRSNLLAMLGSYLGAPSAATVGAGESPNRADAGLAATNLNNGGSSFLRVLLPLLLLGLLVFLGYQFCARPNQEIARVNVNANRVVNSNANATTLNNNTLAIVTSNAAPNANAAQNPAATIFGEDAVRAANERARAALNSLAASGTPQQVVEALNFSIINFAKDSAEIPEENKALLRQAATVLKTAPAETHIEIGGHTDNDGDDAYNQQLATQRANAVKDELTRLGVKAEMLIAKGYGETAPRATNDTPEGRFQNRRIEYKIITDNAATAATVVPSNSHVTTH